MNKNSVFVITPSSLHCFKGEDGFRVEYYSAEDISEYKRESFQRAWRNWSDSYAPIVAPIESFSTSLIVGLTTAFVANSGLLGIVAAAVTIIAIFGFSLGRYFVGEAEQKLPDSPSMIVTFSSKKTSVDRTAVAKAISDNYAQQVITLLDGLNELRKSPSVSYNDYQVAQKTVVSSLGVIGELASKDVLELWGGGNMPTEHQAIMDGLTSINGALIDMRDMRD